MFCKFRFVKVIGKTLCPKYVLQGVRLFFSCFCHPIVSRKAAPSYVAIGLGHRRPIPGLSDALLVSDSQPAIIESIECHFSTSPKVLRIFMALES